jgi:UDP-N-acetylglucosamine 2-epimerase (non-hydrolysing)
MDLKMKIAVILGTRPEIIKMSPIIRILEREAYEYFIVHSRQHYSYNMDKIFFEQLKLPEDIDRGSLSIEA